MVIDKLNPKIASLLTPPLASEQDIAPALNQSVLSHPIAPSGMADILPYDQLQSLRHPARSLHLKGANHGQLYYFGVSHTTNPDHPQFDLLVRQFHTIHPTIMFYEDPGRSLPPDPNQVITLTGEAGFIQYLAQSHGIPSAQLEPPRQAEITAMLQQFSPEQVKLFYVLRKWQSCAIAGNAHPNLNCKPLSFLS